MEKRKVLIVDDEPDIREILNLLLSSNGYKVFSSSDGENAIRILKEEPTIDLIILDIQLPKMNGFEILQKLKESNIGTENIIIASAYAMDTDKQKALAYGIDTYVTKPIDINNFIKIVKTKLEGKS